MASLLLPDDQDTPTPSSGLLGAVIDQVPPLPAPPAYKPPAIHSYYPNNDYVKRGWAPERYPVEALDALAQAEARAVKTGVLPPQLAKYFMPNQLVENRPEDFGIVAPPSVEAGQPDPYADHARKMGIGLTTVQTPYGDIRRYPDYRISSFDDPTRVQSLPMQARMTAMFLAAKPGATAEDKIKAWNGAGPGADNHLMKVRAMNDALTAIPGNKPLLDAYRALVKKYSTEQ
jgi:hypothetical protein